MIDMICESEVSLVVNGIQDRGRGPQNFCSTPRSASIYHRWYPVGYDHMICTSRLQGYHPHRYPIQVELFMFGLILAWRKRQPGQFLIDLQPLHSERCALLPFHSTIRTLMYYTDVYDVHASG